MYAILIHFIGFMFVDLIFPDWAGSASSEFLMLWYGCFAVIDVLALMVCRHKWVRAYLALSCAWSMAIVVESGFGSDVLQAGDFMAQIIIDGGLIFGGLVILLDKVHSVMERPDIKDEHEGI